MKIKTFLMVSVLGMLATATQAESVSANQAEEMCSNAEYLARQAMSMNQSGVPYSFVRDGMGESMKNPVVNKIVTNAFMYPIKETPDEQARLIESYAQGEYDDCIKTIDMINGRTRT